jgi:alpha-L-arabinofuranosidase
VLTADSMDAQPDFDHPARVVPVALNGIRVSDRSIDLTLPAKSVAVIELQP